MKRVLCWLYAFSVIIGLKAQISGQITVDKSDIIITKNGNYDILMWNKSERFISQKGAPKLPVIVESFVVPLDAKVTDVDVSAIQRQQIEGTYFLYPVQPIIPINRLDTILFTEPDSVIYNSNTFINKILTYERADANIDYSYINNSLASVGYIEKKTNQLLYGYMPKIDRFYKKYPQIN